MSTLRFWTNQTVEMESARGAAQTITGISKLSNGVITTSGTLPTNNQYALLTLKGMNQLNNRIVKVSGATGSTFNTGIDTTNFSTFVSGSFQIITMGLAFDSLRNLQPSGGEGQYEDTTTIHDASDTEAIVSASPSGFSATANWDPTDATLIACNSAFIARTPKCFRMADPDGAEFLMYAYISAPLNPGVDGKKKVTPLSWRLLAPGTFY